MYTDSEVEYAVRYAALEGWSRGCKVMTASITDRTAMRDFDLSAMSDAIITDLRQRGIMQKGVVSHV